MCSCVHICCTFHIGRPGTGDGPTRNLGIVMEGTTDAEATAIARKTAQSCAITGLAPCGVSKTKHRRPGIRDSFVRALPAGITDRVGRFRRIPHAASVYARRAAIPFPAGGPASRPQWSRPFGTDGCSMFARMPRYAPAASGIRSTARMRAAGQNGSSRHVPALLDSSSRRIIELNSGLLIRGFGVQVPGGALVMTWGFTTPGHFFRVRFVHMFASRLLARTDPAIRGLSKTGRAAPEAGHPPRRRAVSYGRRRPGLTRPMV